MVQLKKLLLINASFSFFCGFVMLSFSGMLQSFFGFSNAYVFPIIGGNLLFFAACVYLVAMKFLNQKLLINIISSLDGLWVIGSIVISGFQLFNLTSNGYLAISLVAMLIGYFGYSQYSLNQRIGNV